MNNVDVSGHLPATLGPNVVRKSLSADSLAVARLCVVRTKANSCCCTCRRAKRCEEKRRSRRLVISTTIWKEPFL